MLLKLFISSCVPILALQGTLGKRYHMIVSIKITGMQIDFDGLLH
jgi:hypothetical protein